MTHCCQHLKLQVILYNYLALKPHSGHPCVLTQTYCPDFVVQLQRPLVSDSTAFASKIQSTSSFVVSCRVAQGNYLQVVVIVTSVLIT
jgi:hypothetical protein